MTERSPHQLCAPLLYFYRYVLMNTNPSAYLLFTIYCMKSFKLFKPRYTQAVYALGLVFELLAMSQNSYAASRCVNAAGTVVAYAGSAASCPLNTQFKGEVTNVTQVNDADIANAQAQAQRDIKAAHALDAQAAQETKAHVKAQIAAQKSQASHVKQCQAAELALERVKQAVSDVPTSHSIKTQPAKASKAAQKSGASTSLAHTTIRDEDGKPSKAKKKALHKLQAAQSKRDISCH
jgi:endonuclease/exonuclease/phosphatase (EEP) superfamily protein YafD